jgi:Type IV secretion system pilin
MAKYVTLTSMLITAAISKPSLAPLPHAAADKTEIDNALTIVFSIVGAVALLIMVISGLRYIIARDNAQAVSQAKSAIIYAAVGLAISILAISIVSFVAGSLG